MSDCLVAAARWQRENRDAAQGSPSNLLMTAASRALSVLALADAAGLSRLRAAYDPTPQPTQPAITQPPAPISPPPAPQPPGPGSRPGR